MTNVPGISWYEDVEAGGPPVALGSYTFTREKIIDFARRYDPQGFHLDDEAGRNSVFGALCASGWHTAAAFMKCYAAHSFARRAEAEARGDPLPELGPSPGWENLQWHKPVFVDDTVSYTSVVTGKRELATRPTWGLVFVHNEGFNQTGEKVFSFDAKLLFARRR